MQVAAPSLLLTLVGCAGPSPAADASARFCAATAIEVAPFGGEEVIGTLVGCQGDTSDPRWTRLCEGLAGPSRFAFEGEIDSPCAGRGLTISQPSFLGYYLRLWIELDGPEVSARAEIAVMTDEPDGPSVGPPVRSGSISPQELDENGRSRGRFELVLDDLVVSGTYDTASP